jgi:hypothetical protein
MAVLVSHKVQTSVKRLLGGQNIITEHELGDFTQHERKGQYLVYPEPTDNH